MRASVCLPESTVVKRPSNGAAEMKADRVPKGLACHPVKICWASQQFWTGTMSLGHGGESVAPVFLEASANIVDSCEHCGLVRRWGG